MKRLLSIAMLIILTNTSFATRYYVLENATGNTTGLSWTDAFTNLQAALSVSIYNDEIWVGGGTYFASDMNDRDISFVMKNGVNVYGGFGGFETLLSQRDLTLFPTYLSGDIGALGDNTDNTKKIIRIENFATTFILDGFRIISGFDGSSSGEGAGAYIYNNSGGTVFINNCVFYNNYSYYKGGAVSIRYSTVTFSNCEFYFNSSYNYGGGAVYSANVSNSNLYFNDTKFIGNTSRSGAVIQYDGNILNMDRCLVSNNTATTGSIIQVSNANNFTISNSLLVGNLVEFNYDASLISSYSIPANSTNLINVTICHNRNNSSFVPAQECIYKSNSPANVYNSIIYGNTNSDVNAQINSGNNVVNSLVENGYSTGTTILTADPLFVLPSDLASAPFDGSAFDYALRDTSPAVNAGNNALVGSLQFDYQGGIRIQQGTVDLGAIESPFTVSLGENIQERTVLYYDNSSKMIFFRNYGKYRNKEVAIYDINGKLLASVSYTGQGIPVNLPSGMYFVKVNQDAAQRFVVVQ